MEWFCRHFSRRDSAILSVHPHNDRGTAVATAELGLMAGAERVEGMPVRQRRAHRATSTSITLALNLLTQGVDPGLDLSRDRRGAARSSRSATSCPCTRATRTSASSSTRRSPARTRTRSRRGWTRRSARAPSVWDVPYLPIDPKDVGRDYEAIIRVNSQSGKGGVAYLMETEHHLDLPRGLQVDFAQKVQAITDARGGELTGGRADGGVRASTTST